MMNSNLNNDGARAATEPTEVEALLPWYAAGTLRRRDRQKLSRCDLASIRLCEREPLLCKRRDRFRRSCPLEVVREILPACAHPIRPG